MGIENRIYQVGASPDHGTMLVYPVGEEPPSVLTKIDGVLASFRRFTEAGRAAGRDFIGLKTENPDVYSGQALADSLKEDDTALKRIRNLFVSDDQDFESGHKTMIVETGVIGFVAGFVIGARNATAGVRERFVQYHQATIWQRPLEATARLNDTLLFHGARGGIKYGTKVGLAAMGYAGIVNVVQAARNKSGIVEYTLGGVMAGAIWRMNMGITGMLSAALLGAVVGTVGGTLQYGIVRLTGKTYEEAAYWRKMQTVNKFRQGREEALNRQAAKDESVLPLRMHDIFVQADLLPGKEEESGKPDTPPTPNLATV